MSKINVTVTSFDVKINEIKGTCEVSGKTFGILSGINYSNWYNNLEFFAKHSFEEFKEFFDSKTKYVLSCDETYNDCTINFYADKNAQTFLRLGFEFDFSSSKDLIIGNLYEHHVNKIVAQQLKHVERCTEQWNSSKIIENKEMIKALGGTILPSSLNDLIKVPGEMKINVAFDKMIEGRIVKFFVVEHQTGYNKGFSINNTFRSDGKSAKNLSEVINYINLRELRFAEIIKEENEYNKKFADFIESIPTKTLEGIEIDVKKEDETIELSKGDAKMIVKIASFDDRTFRFYSSSLFSNKTKLLSYEQVIKLFDLYCSIVN